MKHRIFTKLSYIFCALALFLIGSLPAGVFPFSVTKTYAKTAGEYACVLQPNTFFYATPDESHGLFLLPQSYYVKLLTYDAAYCQVEYGADGATPKKIVGYVKTEEITPVDYIPVTPYFSHEFILRYQIENDDLGGDPFLNEITLSCTYYGDYKIGSKIYCYVLRGDTFGYVPKPNDLQIPENFEYANYLAQQEQEQSSDDESKEPTSSPAQIAILIALCLLVPVLAALILKPPRRPPYETE